MPVTRQKTSEEWIAILNAAGVPCGPIYTVDKTFADAQVKFLEMAQPVHSNTLGDLTILGHPVGWNGQRNPLRSAAPELGEHNQEVFTALGFTKEEIEDLAKREVI
jgi:formyl-CoA transferase